MSIDSDIPFLLSIVFVAGGLYALAKSADMFIDAAGKIARNFGLSPLLVGMVIIGFGTSAPELIVSIVSGFAGHSNLSLGNAYGSDIFNIGIILGVTALIWPIRVKASVNWFAVPLLLSITLLSWLFVRDGVFERSSGVWLLVTFAILLPVYCWYDQKGSAPKSDGGERGSDAVPFRGVREWFRLLAGLTVLVLSSHLMVWGSVDFARDVLHVSDLLIGLTIVAAGTSLPEFASAIASARRGENEFVIGNIVGSNFFNTLAVVGLSGTISPFADFSRYIVCRDIPVMLAMTLTVAVFGLNYRHPSRQGEISRIEGGLWVVMYVAYLAVMVMQESAPPVMAVGRG